MSNTEDTIKPLAAWIKPVSITALVMFGIILLISLYVILFNTGDKGDSGNSIKGIKGSTGSQGTQGTSGTIENSTIYLLRRYARVLEFEGSASTPANTNFVVLFTKNITIDSTITLPYRYMIQIKFNYTLSRVNDSTDTNEQDSLIPRNIFCQPTLNGLATLTDTGELGLLTSENPKLSSGYFYKLQNSGHYNIMVGFNVDAIKTNNVNTPRLFTIGVEMYNRQGRATKVSYSNGFIEITNA
jgi:hypothetical protein